jgi:hypothetical protein
MRILNLESKTGFYTSLPFEIFDLKGNIFYTSDFVNKVSQGQVHKFNLPRGNYTYNGSLHKLDKPVIHSELRATKKLPKKQRNLGKHRYKIFFAPNPNKCTINHKKHTITFDTAFKDAPLYIKYDIYYHELGHRYYKTEEFADLYASKKMLELGFNPSQIGRSSLISLRSKLSHYRKESKINSLIKKS